MGTEPVRLEYFVSGTFFLQMKPGRAQVAPPIRMVRRVGAKGAEGDT